MLSSAQNFQPNCVLSEYLYRIALSPTHSSQLKDTARLYPQYATWMDSEELIRRGFLHNETSPSDNSNATVYGGLLLTNGCKVIHVRNYLKGIWLSCQEVALKQNNSITWSIYQGSLSSQYLQAFDTIIYSAGSGLFTDKLLQESTVHFPIQLVRGQSLEIILETNSDIHPCLCGKYVIPLSTFPSSRVLVGATHEYSEVPLSKEAVVEELRESTRNMCPNIWHNLNDNFEAITEGYRVQTQRTQYGRIPIVNKIEIPSVGRNCWVFTGLSSRGLIYHSIFGKMMSTAIITNA